MACFIAPVVEAVATTAIKKIVTKKEETQKEEDLPKIPFSKKLGWLNNMLWGGSALLAFEHLWHGEIIPTFPFLTAALNEQDTAQMIHEIATVGVSMSLLVTAVWIGMVIVSAVYEKKEQINYIKE